MKTIVTIFLTLLILLMGCAVQQKKITPAEEKRVRNAFIERLYLDHLLREAEKEFGVEPNDLKN